MKVTFLGTSHGLPGADRFCTSICLEVGENYYFFDSGAPLADQITRMGLDWAKIRAVFNSHPHGDHFLGMLSFVDLVNWYYGETTVDILVPREGQVKLIDDVSQLMTNRPAVDRIRARKYTEGQIYEDDHITVTADRTDHLKGDGDYLSYGFTVTEKATGKRFLFTGDCSAPLDDIKRITAGNSYDLVVTECAHFPYEMLEERFAELDTKKAAVIHVWGLDKYEQIEASRDKYSFELLTPEDGDEIIL